MSRAIWALRSLHETAAKEYIAARDGTRSEVALSLLSKSCDALVMSNCVRMSQYASAVVVAKIVFELRPSERALYFANEPFCLSLL